jgi:hypothetical protein
MFLTAKQMRQVIQQGQTLFLLIQNTQLIYNTYHPVDIQFLILVYGVSPQ